MGEGEVREQEKMEKRGKRSHLAQSLLPLKSDCWIDVISTSLLVPTLKLFTMYIVFSFARIFSRTAWFLLLLLKNVRFCFGLEKEDFEE